MEKNLKVCLLSSEFWKSWFKQGQMSFFIQKFLISWVCVVRMNTQLVIYNAAFSNFIWSQNITFTKSHLLKYGTWQFVSFINARGCSCGLNLSFNWTWSTSEVQPLGFCLYTASLDLAFSSWKRIKTEFWKPCVEEKMVGVSWEDHKMAPNLCKAVIFWLLTLTWVWVLRVRNKFRTWKNYFHKGLH